MRYDILHGRISIVNRDITARCIQIINCADENLLQYMQYYGDRCDPTPYSRHCFGKEFGEQLIGQPPLHKDGTYRIFSALIRFAQFISI